MRCVASSPSFILIALLTACGGGGMPTSPPSPSPRPTPTPAPPVPTSARSGRIANAQAVADILTYNQEAAIGPRRRGVITRWELPVPVRVDPPVKRETVEGALRYWQALTGLTFVITDVPEPSILVRSGTDGLPGVTGRGLVDGVYPNNRARTGLVVMHPDLAGCDFADARCAFFFEHEMGHTLGMLDHVAGGGIMSNGVSASQREIDLLTELYRLPHGARVEPDGSWAVVVE